MTTKTEIIKEAARNAGLKFVNRRMTRTKIQDFDGIPTAGYHVLLDKDQRVYLRTTDGDKAMAEKDRLAAKYPHMGFIVEYHSEP